MMAVQDAKIKNIAKDLTIGTGGPRISDVIGNSLKDHVKKVEYCFCVEDIMVIYCI